MTLEAFDPNTEVSGKAMLALIECVAIKDIAPILLKHNIDRNTLQAEAWHPLQQWLDVLSDIQDEPGFQSTLNMVDIGRTFAQTAYLPDNINTLEDALGSGRNTCDLVN